MASTKPQILFRTTEAQKAALQRLSAATGAPVAWHLRQAVDQYLHRRFKEVHDVEWREDREQLQVDRTGDARMVYSARLGEFYGTIYEARDGTCVWYVRDADGNEVASGEAGRVVDAEEAAQRAAAEHGEECHICSENGIVTPATRYALGMHLCDVCAREYERYLQPGERLEDMTMDEMQQRI